jgi:hypothetical protein
MQYATVEALNEKIFRACSAERKPNENGTGPLE